VAGNQLPRYAREALRAMLTGDLPDYLAAIDGEIDDGINLRRLARIYTAPLMTYDALPCAVILARETRYPDEFRSDDIRVHGLQIQVYEQSIEVLDGLLPSEVVAERVERTMVGIHRMIIANKTLTVSGTEYADHVLIEEIMYSDFEPLESGAILRGGAMNLQVWFSS
jgi:hypothetical protein